MKVLLVSPDEQSRETMRLTVGSIERRGAASGTGPLEFLEARDGNIGIAKAWKELPEVIVADEISSHAGAFALARDLRGAEEAFPGIIIILLDRPQDSWLAKWSGADAWFTKPVDPFALADRIMELLELKEIA